MSSTDATNNENLTATVNNFKKQSYLSLVLKKYFENKLAVVSGIGLIILMIIAISAPIIAPYDPAAVTGYFSLPPSKEFLLGTDQLSRDVLSRLIYASRVSLLVGIGSVIISVIIGTILGLISGYLGGGIDTVIMRITDVFMAFPQLMLILVVVSIIGPSLGNLIIILGILSWTGVARLVRGNVLAIKEVDYVKANIALGLSTPRILLNHIFPNVFASILVNATFGIAATIMLEASLSFLGLGVRPPTASWGNMLTDAQSLTILTSQPWLWVPPGIMIMLTVLAVNFVGDGLREAIDPKSMR